MESVQLQNFDFLLLVFQLFHSAPKHKSNHYCCCKDKLDKMVYLVFGYGLWHAAFRMVCYWLFMYLVFGILCFVFEKAEPGGELDNLKAGSVDLLDQAEDRRQHVGVLGAAQY